MLDENLPTFRFKPAADNPLSSILYFTQNGADPAAEYVFRRADPALPASRNKYAVALCDPINPAVVYGEVLVEPEWSQPTLSAAEVRAQQQSGAPPATATAAVPETFTVQLYNPDQTIALKLVSGGWNKSDSWEFEMPVQTFRQPSASEIDRQAGASPVADLVPRIMFRWKKDGRLSKDLTCYMSGTSLGGRKNKEPDITVALFKAAKDSVVTIYEPNLHRVEVEDRKGLEVVLLLGAEVIKDLFLMPKMDVFNVQGGGPPAGVNGGKRKNSRPNATVAAAVPVGPPPTMSGANQYPGTKPSPVPQPTYAMNSTPTAVPIAAGASTADIDAETRRLQAMVEKEEREREKKEKAEQKRIKKMLEEEEKERRRREAEIAKETERLRKKYGLEGQELPPLPPRNPNSVVGSSPNVSPRPPQPQQFFPPPPTVPVGGPPPHFYNKFQQGIGHLATPPPALPPRPVSAGPSAQSGGPFHCAKLNAIWNGPSGNGWGGVVPPPHLAAQFRQQAPQPQPGARPRRGSGGAPYMEDRPAQSRREEEKRKVQKKRSSHW
ncbi:hypothetical protein QBC47DRAFT_79508 [Echria macrotheca]|uniref:Uncharacterized protein n=1 Tax=Echria macrotheca TaxID=438768 RepID=A0AAJ0B9N3_9PEZI|nr:hypothetical protein QBC47DRAFT_79508 [Echria macrotheca]